jgi:hypothetical protein
MDKLDKKINKIKRNLPEDYIRAISQLDVTSLVSEIAQKQGLSEKDTEIIDQEVMYLLLDIQGPPEFLEQIEENIDLDHDQSLNIIKDVNKKILRPIEKKMEESDKQMPVPPPPEKRQNNPPTPDYGGGSDPYREPTE